MERTTFFPPFSTIPPKGWSPEFEARMNKHFPLNFPLMPTYKLTQTLLDRMLVLAAKRSAALAVPVAPHKNQAIADFILSGEFGCQTESVYKLVNLLGHELPPYVTKKEQRGNPHELLFLYRDEQIESAPYYVLPLTTNFHVSILGKKIKIVNNMIAGGGFTPVLDPEQIKKLFPSNATLSFEGGRLLEAAGYIEEVPAPPEKKGVFPKGHAEDEVR